MARIFIAARCFCPAMILPPTSDRRVVPRPPGRILHDNSTNVSCQTAAIRDKELFCVASVPRVKNKDGGPYLFLTLVATG